MNITESVVTGTAVVVTITALVAAIGTLATKIRTAWTEIKALREGAQKQEKRTEDTKKQVEQHGDQLADQQKVINSLVAYAMSASIFRHLCGITLLRTYNLEFNDTNRRELYFLRDHGFIQPRSGGFLDFSGGTRNVAEMAAPTPIGRFYVSVRKDEIPSEMRSDKNNLLADLSTL